MSKKHKHISATKTTEQKACTTVTFFKAVSDDTETDTTEVHLKFLGFWRKSVFCTASGNGTAGSAILGRLCLRKNAHG